MTTFLNSQFLFSSEQTSVNEIDIVHMIRNNLQVDKSVQSGSRTNPAEAGDIVSVDLNRRFILDYLF